jgi:predicted SAM-dependent methyltransferase
MSVPELRRQYKELDSKELVEVDIVDNGEALSSIENGMVDFVVANHLIEHCEDPIGALSNWLRATRKGGIVYMAVPDKRFCFDHKRPLTEFDHLLGLSRPLLIFSERRLFVPS